MRSQRATIWKAHTWYLKRNKSSIGISYYYQYGYGYYYQYFDKIYEHVSIIKSLGRILEIESFTQFILSFPKFLGPENAFPVLSGDPPETLLYLESLVGRICLPPGLASLYLSSFLFTSLSSLSLHSLSFCGPALPLKCLLLQALLFVSYSQLTESQPV